MVAGVKKLAKDWKYNAVSIGYPGVVIRNRPVADPYNLGSGWAGFDFGATLKCPVKAINDAVGIPIIVYNIPARSVIDMSVDTMKRLFELSNIAGVKDATANVVRVSQQRAAMGEGFNQLSGEDATALGFMAHGGHGCISVTSNVAPRLCAEFQNACLNGDYATALKLQDKLMPLHMGLFLETNPAPAKYALSVLGKCADTVRLPMVRLAEKTKAAVHEAMVHTGLIN